MGYFLRNFVLICGVALVMSSDLFSANLQAEVFDLSKELQAIEARLEPWQKQADNSRYALIKKLEAWVTEYSSQEEMLFERSLDQEKRSQKEILAKRFELFIRWVQKRDPTLKQHLKVLYAEASALQDRPLLGHELSLVARMQARVLSWLLVEDLRPYREALSDRFQGDNRSMEILFKMKKAPDALTSRKPLRWHFVSDWQSFVGVGDLDSSPLGLEALAASAGAELEIDFLRKNLGTLDLAATEELRRLVQEELEKHSRESFVRGEFVDHVVDYLLEARVSRLKDFQNPRSDAYSKTQFRRIFLDRPGEKSLIFSAYRKALRTLVTNRLRSQPCQSVLKKIHP